ncbi:MAG: response regulator [Oligoflexia bacterium]|nr:response regulator [Oligoflexia bacterium]
MLNKKNKIGVVSIVDACLENVEAVSNILTSHAYQVHVIKTGVNAMEWIMENTPDLILLSTTLPDMDAYEVCTHLKGNKKTSRLPVIFLSSQNTAQSSEKQRGFAAGGDDFISKPFQTEELLVRVKNHIELAHFRSVQQWNSKGIGNRRNCFLEMFNQFPLGVALFDPATGRINQFNPMFAKITGRSFKEMDKTSWKGLVHGDDLQGFLNYISSLNSGEISSFSMENRILRIDGSAVSICVTVAAVTVIDNSPPQYLAVVEDITECKRIESAIRKKQFLFSEMGRIAKIGGWEIDCKTNELSWTDEVAIIHDLDPTRPITLEHGLSYYTPDSRPIIDKALKEAMALGQSYDLVLEKISAKGERKWIRTIGSPIKEGGRVVKLIGIFQDISERKKAEEENIKLQAQLAHSEKLASIGVLVAGVAHEINNPLTIIQGFNSIIKEILINDNGEKQKENIFSLLKKQDIAVDRISNIVNGLRKYTAIDSNNLELIEINKTLKETMSICEAIYKQSDISIELFLSPSPLHIYGNNGKLQQVVMNILHNAKDAIEEKGVYGKIKVEAFGNDDKCIIKIQDNGIGISDEIINKLFDPFYTTKKIGEGTGLGLAISQSIIVSFGGKINFESKKNLGTVCLIEIPLTDDKETICNIEIEDAFERITGKVLIVEDEEENREILKYYLVSFGLEVVDCKDGIEALEQIQKRDFDYILTDLKMPKMSGYQLIKEIEKYHLTRAKIIVVSGNIQSDFSAEKESQESLCLYDYIKKPFNKKNVYNVLKPGLRSETCF